MLPCHVQLISATAICRPVSPQPHLSAPKLSYDEPSYCVGTYDKVTYTSAISSDGEKATTNIVTDEIAPRSNDFISCSGPHDFESLKPCATIGQLSDNKGDYPCQPVDPAKLIWQTNGSPLNSVFCQVGCDVRQNEVSIAAYTDWPETLSICKILCRVCSRFRPIPQTPTFIDNYACQRLFGFGSTSGIGLPSYSTLVSSGLPVDVRIGEIEPRESTFA